MAALVNSVGRLHRILSEAKYSVEGTTRARLAATFGVDPADQLAFFHSFAQLFELLDEAEEQVNRLITDRVLEPSDYLSSISRVREALTLMSRNLEAPWRERRERISEVDLKTLRICADFVPSTEAENPIGPDELSKLILDIDDLTESTIHSNIQQDLKVLILDHLQEARKAVNDYRIRGAVRIREAGMLGLGTAVVIANQIFINEGTGRDIEATDKTVLNRYSGFIQKLVNLAASALKAKPLLDAAIKYLPLLLGSGNHPPSS